MAEIPAALVKQLRERTGAGFMECKKALTEANGNLEEAETVLRKRGIAVAQKKAGREANEGLVGTYIHTGGKLGVLVEVNCESDFVARTDDFQQLVHDIAMHIAAADPRFIRKEDVERGGYREGEGNPARPRLAGRQAGEGRRQDRRRAHGQVLRGDLLLEQPFVKDNSVTVKELITSLIAKLGENIVGRPYGPLQGR